MIINSENIENLPIKSKEVLKAILLDLEKINQKSKSNLYIDWQDFHNEIGEIPDFYGMYSIMCGDMMLGSEMNLTNLDASICLLHNYIIDLDETNN